MAGHKYGQILAKQGKPLIFADLILVNPWHSIKRIYCDFILIAEKLMKLIKNYVAPLQGLKFDVRLWLQKFQNVR